MALKAPNNTSRKSKEEILGKFSDLTKIESFIPFLVEENLSTKQQAMSDTFRILARKTLLATVLNLQERGIQHYMVLADFCVLLEGLIGYNPGIGRAEETKSMELFCFKVGRVEYGLEITITMNENRILSIKIDEGSPYFIEYSHNIYTTKTAAKSIRTDSDNIIVGIRDFEEEKWIDHLGRLINILSKKSI